MSAVKSLKFIRQYITKPRTTGAILPSSRFLARKMVARIDFSAARCIVEYGPGTGVFSEKILAARRDSTVVILLERNEDFCAILREKFRGAENFFIENDSAENIGEHLRARGFERADFVISGLPFASLPAEVSERILTNTREFLADGGAFITFQYTLFKKKIFLRHFPQPEITREIRNVPPAYVLKFVKET